MHRDRPFITKKRNEMDLRPGQHPRYTAMVARINLRKLMGRT